MYNPVDKVLVDLAPTSPLTSPPRGHHLTSPPCPLPSGARGEVKRRPEPAFSGGQGRSRGVIVPPPLQGARPTRSAAARSHLTKVGA